MTQRDRSSESDWPRELAAARADLAERRQRALADVDARLEQLAHLAEDLDAGRIEARAAKGRLRRILGERGGIATTARAGRTTIGLSAPAAKNEAAAPLHAPRATVESALAKALQRVEQRLGQVVGRPNSTPADRAEAQLEIALLMQIQRSLIGQTGRSPADPVLLAALDDQIEDAHGTLAALESGGLARAHALVAFTRDLLSQLAALGGADAGSREHLQRARALLQGTAPQISPALQEATTLYARLQHELDRRLPSSSTSLVDDILRP